MLEPMVARALAFAVKAHGSQVRKYTGESYIVHPIEVMMLVKTVAHDETMLATALLHDVLEDTEATTDDLVREFGYKVTADVVHLTDAFTKEAYPDMGRRWRKQQEALRLSRVPSCAQTVKVADLISNTRTVVQHDPHFAKRYMAEKQHLLNNLPGADPHLKSQALAGVHAYFADAGVFGKTLI